MIESSVKFVLYILECALATTLPAYVAGAVLAYICFKEDL